MKRIFCLFSIVILNLGCSNSRKVVYGDLVYTRSYKNWQQQFKDRVLCNCMLSGINDKIVTDKVLSIDRSFYDEIDIVLRGDIKDILTPVLIKMKRDSLESIANVSEGGAGKHVFDSCIKFYRSKALDSISKAELKKWKKINVDSLRSSLNPTY